MEIEFNLIILALSFCRCIIIIIIKGFVISIVAGTYYFITFISFSAINIKLLKLYFERSIIHLISVSILQH